MLNRAKHWLQRHLCPDQSTLLAFSGGLDSRVLLDLMLDLGHQPALAHFNFRFRGKESWEDAAWIEALSEKLKLRLHLKSVDAAAYARANKLSPQMAARELRYGFFSALLQEEGYALLLTAHHFDDALETFLLNLARGSGLQGLRPMPIRREHIARPLLSHRKEELLAYAQARHLDWREDSSNASDHYQRNHLRHHALPALEAAFPNFASGASRSLQNLDQQWRALRQLLEEKLTLHLRKGKDQEILAVGSLYQEDCYPALLHHWLQNHGPFPWEDLYAWQPGESGRELYSPSHQLLLHREELILRPRQAQAQEKEEYPIAAKLSRLEHPLALEFQVVSRKDLPGLNFGPQVALVDYQRLKFPLCLRPWHPGDHFQPLGMSGHKKISDFLNDLKLQPPAKEAQWLLCSGDQVVWVVGQRIDDSFKVTDSTKTVYFSRLINP